MARKKPVVGSLQLNPNKFIDIQNITEKDFAKSSSEEKQGHVTVRKSVSYWEDAWRRLKENKVAMIAMGIIILLFLFAFFGPLFVDYTYDQQIRGSANLRPMQYSENEIELKNAGEKVFPHVFGTDTHGRDILVRLMYGTRISMSIGVIAAVLVLLIGSVYGAISGYIGGLTDSIMMRVAEIIYSVPDVLVVLILSITMKPALEAFANQNLNNFMGKFVNSLGSSIISIFITFALLYWVSMSMIIRGQIMQIKEQEFVLAARALGASNSRIIRKHLLPNCIGSMIAATCLQIPSAIFLESFLSFLGFGVNAPMTSLGSMAADALSGMQSYSYRLIIPSIFLSVLILSFNLFGDGLRDALDPRLKK